MLDSACYYSSACSQLHSSSPELDAALVVEVRALDLA